MANHATDTDWSQLTHYRLDCNGFTMPIQISWFFRNNDIKSYLYKMMYRNIPIKYGQSCNDSSRTPGNRVYSQLGGLDSFGFNKLNRGVSKDFRSLANHFQATYDKVLDHNDVSIEIWSFDNYKFITVDHEKEIKQAESSLITTHVLHYGQMPIGNKTDESSSFNRPAVIAAVYNKFFNEV